MGMRPQPGPPRRSRRGLVVLAILVLAVWVLDYFFVAPLQGSEYWGVEAWGFLTFAAGAVLGLRR
jgi:hypothetical protein